MDEQPEQRDEAQPPRRRKRRRRVERRYRFEPRQQRKLPKFRRWREVLMGGLLVTAVFFFINPFYRLALARSSVASPATPLAVTPPAQPEQGYCLAGNFQEWSGVDTPLLDDGTEGDRTAGDGIYSRTVVFTEPERYLWRVLPCGQWDFAVPERSAWLFVTEPNQAITFTFNPAMPESRLWPRSYALTANDTLPALPVVVGTFQPDRWDSEDEQTAMEPIDTGQYQLIYTVPQPNTYEAYVVLQGRGEGVGASGRSMGPIPLEFTTEYPAEMVVFQYDARTDRIAVLSGIPWWLSWLGFSWGATLLGAIALAAFLGLGAQVAYRRIVERPDWQHNAVCPDCQQHDFKRIKRETPDYILDFFSIPVRRYQCKHCGWEGRRLYRRHR